MSKATTIHPAVPAEESISQSSKSAQSSIRRGPHILGVLRFGWSWFVAGFLLLVFAPPVLLLGILFKKQNWIYWWANWGALTWLGLLGVKVGILGGEELDPKQTYEFGANH